MTDSYHNLPFTRVPNALIYSDKLTTNEKMVYIYISSFDPSFPSMRMIGEKLGLSKTTVQKCVYTLLQYNLIERFKKNQRVVTYRCVLSDRLATRKD
jgi:predicted transcriptional regulator